MEIPVPAKDFASNDHWIYREEEIKNITIQMEHLLKKVDDEIYATSGFWKGKGNEAFLQHYIQHRIQVSNFTGLFSESAHNLQESDSVFKTKQESESLFITTDTKRMRKTGENLKAYMEKIRDELHNAEKIAKDRERKQNEMEHTKLVSPFFDLFQENRHQLSRFCDVLEKDCENIKLAMEYYEGNETSINDTVFWLSV